MELKPSYECCNSTQSLAVLEFLILFTFWCCVTTGTLCCVTLRSLDLPVQSFNVLCVPAWVPGTSKTSTSGEGHFGRGCPPPAPKFPGTCCTQLVVITCICFSLSCVQGERDKVAATCGRKTCTVVVYLKILHLTKYTHMNVSKDFCQGHCEGHTPEPFRDQRLRFKVGLLFVVGGCFLVESRSKGTSPH